MDIIIFLTLFAIGFGAGRIAEQSHFRSLETREAALRVVPENTLRAPPEGITPVRSRLVMGSAVISLDYFKRVVAGLRGLIGGEVRSYSSLVERARREALLRMKESAPNADMIINVRIETSVIGENAQRRNSVGSVEALAYGTAVYTGQANQII